MRQKLLILAAIVIGVIGISLGGVYFWFDHKVHAVGPLLEEKAIVISKGQGVRSIGATLQAEGVIEDEFIFALYVRLNEAHRQLKAGEYLFKPGMNIPDVLAHLSSNDTVIHSITIPEGLTSIEIVGLLNAENILSGVIEEIPAQGSLLPETYHFSRGASRQSILNRMRNSLEDYKAEIWAGYDSSKMPYKTWEEVVTLASIVEKETALAEERPQVASVFVNRLRKRMRLQSDPTVIFALTDGLKPLGRKLTRKDWKVQHPYNTYVIKALPPGPIANPGKQSLHAVLFPDETSYLYFVADGTGGHAFAKTLKEHNRNVAHWRKVRKN